MPIREIVKLILLTYILLFFLYVQQLVNLNEGSYDNEQTDHLHDDYEDFSLSDHGQDTEHYNQSFRFLPPQCSSFN